MKRHTSLWSKKWFHALLLGSVAIPVWLTIKFMSPEGDWLVQEYTKWATEHAPEMNPGKWYANGDALVNVPGYKEFTSLLGSSSPITEISATGNEARATVLVENSRIVAELTDVLRREIGNRNVDRHQHSVQTSLNGIHLTINALSKYHLLGIRDAADRQDWEAALDHGNKFRELIHFGAVENPLNGYTTVLISLGIQRRLQSILGDMLSEDVPSDVCDQWSALLAKLFTTPVSQHLQSAVAAEIFMHEEFAPDSKFAKTLVKRSMQGYRLSETQKSIHDLLSEAEDLPEQQKSALLQAADNGNNTKRTVWPITGYAAIKAQLGTVVEAYPEVMSLSSTPSEFLKDRSIGDKVIGIQPSTLNIQTLRLAETQRRLMALAWSAKAYRQRHGKDAASIEILAAKYPELLTEAPRLPHISPLFQQADQPYLPLIMDKSFPTAGNVTGYLPPSVVSILDNVRGEQSVLSIHEGPLNPGYGTQLRFQVLPDSTVLFSVRLYEHLLDNTRISWTEILENLPYRLERNNPEIHRVSLRFDFRKGKQRHIGNPQASGQAPEVTSISLADFPDAASFVAALAEWPPVELEAIHIDVQFLRPIFALRSNPAGLKGSSNDVRSSHEYVHPLGTLVIPLD